MRAEEVLATARVELMRGIDGHVPCAEVVDRARRLTVEEVSTIFDVPVEVLRVELEVSEESRAAFAAFEAALLGWVAQAAEVLRPFLEQVAAALGGTLEAVLDDPRYREAIEAGLRNGFFDFPFPDAEPLDDNPGGCWADVWEDDAEDYLACGGPPAEGDELGLCATHARTYRELRT